MTKSGHIGKKAKWQRKKERKNERSRSPTVLGWKTNPFIAALIMGGNKEWLWGGARREGGSERDGEKRSIETVVFVNWICLNSNCLLSVWSRVLCNWGQGNLNICWMYSKEKGMRNSSCQYLIIHAKIMSKIMLYILYVPFQLFMKLPSSNIAVWKLLLLK